MEDSIKDIFCPNIVEERQLNATVLDVYSRLMMDRIIFLGGEVNAERWIQLLLKCCF